MDKSVTPGDNLLTPGSYPAEQRPEPWVEDMRRAAPIPQGTDSKAWPVRHHCTRADVGGASDMSFAGAGSGACCASVPLRRSARPSGHQDVPDHRTLPRLRRPAQDVGDWRRLLPVIWQSGPWKQDLIDLFETCERQYRDLGDLAERGWWEDAVRAQQVQKAVFVSAFIVRKLIESFRLSVQAESESLQVLAFPLREPERLQHASNWDDLHRWYDLDAGRAQTVPLRTWPTGPYIRSPSLPRLTKRTTSPAFTSTPTAPGERSSCVSTGPNTGVRCRS